MNTVYLSLGSNQGNRIEFLQKSIDAIELYIGTPEQVSSYYETEPWGFISENRFINQVVRISTILSASQVMQKILQIEHQFGRERNPEVQEYVNRTVDIDVLFYNNLVFKTEDLVIPHKFMHLRRFVLEPLNEIAPDLMHPIMMNSVKELLKNCNDKMHVKKYLSEEIVLTPI
jgi:2-amino-4-hydroxy-6-hydroxymethyldihydropteridine diphosphokinase